MISAVMHFFCVTNGNKPLTYSHFPVVCLKLPILRYF